MTPPGMVQPDLYVGFRMSSRPDRSKMRAPAETGIAGTSPVSGTCPPVGLLSPITATTVRTLRQLAARRTWLRTRAGLPSGKPASLSSRRINVTWCSGVSGGVTCPLRFFGFLAEPGYWQYSRSRSPPPARSWPDPAPQPALVSRYLRRVRSPRSRVLSAGRARPQCGRRAVRPGVALQAVRPGLRWRASVATDAGADNDGGLAVGCLVRSISISGG